MLANSCGDEDAVGPEAGSGRMLLYLNAWFDPSAILPGDTSVLIIVADPGESRLTELTVTFSELLDTTLTISVPRAGPVGYGVFIRPPRGPIEGKLNATVTARTNDLMHQVTAVLSIVDDGPPRLEVGIDSVIAPGDSFAISYSAEDVAGITRVAVWLSGALVDSQVVSYRYEPAVGQAILYSLPVTAPMGDSVRYEIVVADGFVKETRRVGIVRVGDPVFPTISASVDSVRPNDLPWARGLLFLTGDTLRIRVVASDQRRLGWIGYRIPDVGEGDSVPSSRSADTVRFERVVPTGWDANALIAFARDSMGNEARRLKRVNMVDGAWRPYQFADPGISFGGAQLYDPKRNLLFATDGGERLIAISIASLAPVDTVTLPGFPGSIDLVPGGDSIVVGFPGREILGIVNLATQDWPVDTIPLTMLDGRVPWKAGVTAQNRVIVSLNLDGMASKADSSAYEVDLGDGRQRLRSVAGWLRNLTVSGDRLTVLSWVPNAEGTIAVSAYRVAGDTFDPVKKIRGGAPTSMSHDGTQVLAGRRLYDGSLSTDRWLGALSPRAYVLSPDGQAAFAGHVGRLRKVSTSDGSILDRVYVPLDVRRIMVLDPVRVLVFARTSLAVVELR